MRIVQMSALLMVAGGCSHTLGYSQLSADVGLRIEGTGTATDISLLCLTPDQINTLMGGNTPPAADKAVCYETALITAKSSQVSNAVAAYLQAQKALAEDVGVVTSSPPSTADATGKPKTDATASTATTAILKGVLEGTATKANIVALKQTLTPENKVEVVRALTDAATTSKNEGTKTNINNAAASLQ